MSRNSVGAGLALGLRVSLNKGQGGSGVPAPPGFLPSDVSNLELWYDADDATTITDTGGLVDQWDDKSGNSRNLISSGTDRPTITTDSGDAAIQFSGAEFLSVTGLSTFNTSGEASIFAVMRQTVTTGTQSFFVIANSSNDDIPLNRTQSGSATRSEFDGTTQSRVDLAVSIDTLRRYIVARHDSANNSDIVNNLGNSATDISTGGLAQNAEKVFVGRDRFAGNFFNGFLMELGYYSRRITDLERTDIEDYLASKWSL